MKVQIRTKDDSGDYPLSSNYIYNNVVLIQDKQKEIMIKTTDNDCIYFSKDQIDSLGVDVNA